MMSNHKLHQFRPLLSWYPQALLQDIGDYYNCIFAQTIYFWIINNLIIWYYYVRQACLNFYHWAWNVQKLPEVSPENWTALCVCIPHIAERQPEQTIKPHTVRQIDSRDPWSAEEIRI